MQRVTGLDGGGRLTVATTEGKEPPQRRWRVFCGINKIVEERSS